MTATDKRAASTMTIGSDITVINEPKKTRRKDPNAESLVAIVLPPVILGILLLAGWYGITYGLLEESKRFLLVPPHEVITEGFGDSRILEEIMSGAWSSTKVALVGLGTSIVLGFATAIAMSQSKLIERAMFPYMVALQAIPILALVPLIGFWFGYGFPSRVLVVIIISIFPIIVNTLFGLQSAEKGLHNLFTLHHASRITRMRKLQFPGALPAIFAGLRISAGLSVIGAIVGDFFFGQGETGIGQLLRKYANALQGAPLLAAVAVSCAMGIIVFLMFGWLQNTVIGKWHDETD